jgi:hypothetical protein
MLNSLVVRLCPSIYFLDKQTKSEVTSFDFGLWTGDIVAGPGWDDLGWYELSALES